MKNELKYGEINKEICVKLKKYRIMAGISQIKMSQFLSISRQQYQGYESGKTPLKAFHLALIATKLNIPVKNFYEPCLDLSEDIIMDADTLTLVKKIQKIKEPFNRKLLYHVIHTYTIVENKEK